MSIGFPTAPLAFRLRGAGGGAVENPQAAQRFHYPARKPVQLIPTTANVPIPPDIQALILQHPDQELDPRPVGIGVAHEDAFA